MANLRELSTRAEPDTITIDGVAYELADAGAFSTLESSRMRTLGRRVAALGGKDDLTEDEARECDAAIDAIFRLIAASVPDEVVARLRSSHKLAVIEAFTSRLIQQSAAQAATLAADSITASMPSSGGSNGSTAGASASG